MKCVSYNLIENCCFLLWNFLEMIMISWKQINMIIMIVLKADSINLANVSATKN